MGEVRNDTAEGSKLYQTYIVPDESHDGLSRKVWGGTPWVISVWVGDDDPTRWTRERKMAEWCNDHLGDQAFPFGENPRPGQWRSGNAIVFGWTWWGFATEAQADQFAAAWPTPDEIVAARALQRPGGET